MNMGEKIHDLRVKHEMTLQELGDRVGVGKSTVRKWENGMIANMRRDKILLVATALGTTPSYLMGWDEKKKGVPINVYGRVSAGIPIEMIEDIIDVEEIPESLARTGTFFGLKIQGDSMEPKISDGDIVIVRQQNDAETGDVVIASINGETATCKRLKKYRDGIELIPTNPSYEPMFFKNAEIKEKPVCIIGKVIELRAKF